MPEAGNYRLPDDVSERIFDQLISRDLLEAEASSNPTVIFVIGQPGAGKSRAEASLRNDLGRNDAVGLDADEIHDHWELRCPT